MQVKKLMTYIGKVSSPHQLILRGEGKQVQVNPVLPVGDQSQRVAVIDPAAFWLLVGSPSSGGSNGDGGGSSIPSPTPPLTETFTFSFDRSPTSTTPTAVLLSQGSASVRFDAQNESAAKMYLQFWDRQDLPANGEYQGVGDRWYGLEANIGVALVDPMFPVSRGLVVALSKEPNRYQPIDPQLLSKVALHVTWSTSVIPEDGRVAPDWFVYTAV